MTELNTLNGIGGSTTQQRNKGLLRDRFFLDVPVKEIPAILFRYSLFFPLSHLNHFEFEILLYLFSTIFFLNHFPDTIFLFSLLSLSQLGCSCCCCAAMHCDNVFFSASVLCTTSMTLSIPVMKIARKIYC